MQPQLPDMHGLRVLDALRNREATIDVPVIVLSASAFPAQVMQALDRGAASYLAKPLDFEQFLLEVRARLRASAATR